jgi:FMN-dependent NADH-azoreductase
MKTLIVKYLPRNERSNTKKLLDAFMKQIKNSVVEELDLSDDVPDIFLRDNLLAYINRNFLGQELSPKEKKLLFKMDRMTAQLKSADIVVVAFPMYNFSMSAVVKAWFDSVIQKGETWDRRNGELVKCMAGKKALIIVSSGGIFSKGQFSDGECALSLAKLEFQFMGYSDVQGILAEGMAMNEEAKLNSLNKSINQVRTIAKEWYVKNEIPLYNKSGHKGVG